MCGGQGTERSEYHKSHLGEHLKSPGIMTDQWGRNQKLWGLRRSDPAYPDKCSRGMGRWSGLTGAFFGKEERGITWKQKEGTRWVPPSSTPRPSSITGVGEKTTTDRTVERAVASAVRFQLEQRGEGTIQTRGWRYRGFCWWVPEDMMEGFQELRDEWERGLVHERWCT